MTSLAVSPDGKYLASGSRDFSIRLWDINTGVVLRTCVGHTEEVAAIAFSPDGRQMASGAPRSDRAALEPRSDGCASQIRGREWPRLVGDLQPGRAADRRRRRRSACAYLGYGQWSRTEDSERAYAADHRAGISSRRDAAASASGDKTIRVWDIESGKTIRTIEGHEGPVLSIAFRGDGKQILSGSADRTARLWDANTGQVLAVLGGHTAFVSAVGVRGDGARRRPRPTDGTVKIWNLADGKQGRSELSGARYRGRRWIAYSPNGQELATCGSDRQARIWNLASRPIKQPIVLQGHSGPLTSIAFSPNGRFLASGGADQVVKVWNIASKSEQHSFRGHSDWVTSVAFANDGRAIVSASVDHFRALVALCRG